MASTFQNVAITYWVQSCHLRLQHKNLPQWWLMKLSKFNSHYVKKKSFLNLMYPNEGVFYFSFFVHKVHNELRTMILHPYPQPQKAWKFKVSHLGGNPRADHVWFLYIFFLTIFFCNKVLSSNSRNQVMGQIKSSTKIITRREIILCNF